MRLKYAVRNVGEVAVLDLSGPISPGKTIEDRLVLHDLVADRLKSGHTKILFNLAEVTFIDSSGIGDLLGAMQVVKGEGGQLLICNASQRIADLLYRTHLDSIIRCFHDETAALQAFSGNGHETISAA